MLPWQVTIDQLICASLSHTHYWYEVGMLKVSVVVYPVDASSASYVVVVVFPHLFYFLPALVFLYSRARSLRNLLVSGNECGRVFPAGVGPGSPSRDAANWLPSRFSLSVETRRRYGWLRMMVFPGARLFPSPNLVPFGRVAARERQGALSRRAW